MARSRMIVVHPSDIEWADATDVFGLPNGLKMKLLNKDEETGRMDSIIQFPPGYHEPRHTHEGYHTTVILEGEQIVDGVVLGPGDYAYGPADEPHGPFDYPNGCILFGSMWGGAKHEYDESQDAGPKPNAASASRKPKKK